MITFKLLLIFKNIVHDLILFRSTMPILSHLVGYFWLLIRIMNEQINFEPL